MSSLLEFDAVSKRFSKRLDVIEKFARRLGAKVSEHTVHAVDQVSFAVNEREVVGLVGESGCGKSTLGRVACGLYAPSDGVVRYRGQPVAHINGARRPIQMIFQDPFASLNPRMRVAQIIGEAPRVHGLIDAKQIEDYVAQLLKRVGLDPAYVRRYPHQFSGGQRARIGIARALAVKPEFLVCDEAVAALDVSIQAQVLNLFMDLRDQFQLTYLFISHDLGVVRHLSDRVVVMYLGRVVEIAATEALVCSAQPSVHAGAADRSTAHRSQAACVRSDQGRNSIAAGAAAGMPLSSALPARDAALFDRSAGACARSHPRAGRRAI